MGLCKHQKMFGTDAAIVDNRINAYTALCIALYHNLILKRKDLAHYSLRESCQIVKQNQF